MPEVRGLSINLIRYSNQVYAGGHRHRNIMTLWLIRLSRNI